MTWMPEWQKQIGREKITSCLVLQNGEPTFTYYKNRKAADKLHKVHSVTKSITSALVGICLEKGLLDSLDHGSAACWSARWSMDPASG